jgi:outer membrane protein OmpA-like peptidoglycan-associated protein
MSSSFAAADGDEGVPGPQNHAFSIGVTAGMFVPDANVHNFYFGDNEWQPLNSIGPAMGLRLSYEPTRYAGIEAEGEVIPIGTDAGDAATMMGWRAHFIGQLPGRVTPFILAGGGSMALVSADDVLGDDNDPVGHFGLGAKFYMTSRLSARMDGRWLIASKHYVDGATDNTVNHFLVSTSLTWRLGPSTQVEVSRPDPDGDGVLGAHDRCPTEPGAEPDGCPAVADRDRDGILDTLDRCPEEPETVNQLDDDDGCPDKALDQDADGIADHGDACPNAAEDMDGFQDEDGCPDADNDSDGLADAKDGCPQVAGPADNHGCPDKDSDMDGMVDRLDNCPQEAGQAKFSGCRGKQLVVIGQTEVRVLENIAFASGKAEIRARSNPLLDNLVMVLNAHPEVTRVHIEGHTDSRGDASMNKDLSRRRAQAVTDYLVAKGVSVDRLDAIGHGEESPISDNRKSSGRAENRRVAFRIERGLVVVRP